MSATVADGEGEWGSMVVAVLLSAVRWPVVEGSSGDGRSALVVAGAGPVGSGQMVAWCKVVAVAVVVVRRDGRVQVASRPVNHARWGVLEEELDTRCGPDTIDGSLTRMADTAADR